MSHTNVQFVAPKVVNAKGLAHELFAKSILPYLPTITISSTGEPHSPVFTATVLYHGGGTATIKNAPTKMAAEHAAYAEFLANYQKRQLENESRERLAKHAKTMQTKTEDSVPPQALKAPVAPCDEEIMEGCASTYRDRSPARGNTGRTPTPVKPRSVSTSKPISLTHPLVLVPDRTRQDRVNVAVDGLAAENVKLGKTIKGLEDEIKTLNAKNVTLKECNDVLLHDREVAVDQLASFQEDETNYASQVADLLQSINAAWTLNDQLQKSLNDVLNPKPVPVPEPIKAAIKAMLAPYMTKDQIQTMLIRAGIESNPGPVAKATVKSSPSVKKAVKREVKKEVRKIPKTTVLTKSKTTKTTPNRPKRADVGVETYSKSKASAIAAVMANPEACGLVDDGRIGGLFTTPTAISNPYLREILKNQSASYDTQTGFAFRDVYRNSIISINPGRSALSAYLAYYAPSETNPEPAAVQLLQPEEFCNIDVGEIFEFPLLFGYAVSASGPSVHGPILCAGTPDGNQDSPGGRFFWFDAGVTLSISHTYTTTGTCLLNRNIYLQRWTNSGVTVTDLQIGSTTTNGTGTITVDTSGYYSLWCRTEPTVAAVLAPDRFSVGLGISIASSVRVYGHRTIPAFNLNYATLANARVNSISMMYTNTANPLYRGGAVYSMQAPSGTYWPDFVTGTTPLADAANVDYRTSENGSYGYLKTTQPSDMNMHIHHAVSPSGALADVYYPLNTPSDYLVSQVVSASPEFATQTWTWRVVLEFTTLNIFFEMMEPDGSIEDYQKAMELIKKMDQWSENPKHLKNILAGIRQAAKVAFKYGEKYGPTIIRGAKMLQPLIV